MIRVSDHVRLRLDTGGTRTVIVDETRVPDPGTGFGLGAWAYDKDGACYWLDTEDGHAYRAEDAARVHGHIGRFTA